MDFKEDFSQLLKIQLLSLLKIEVDPMHDAVTVTLTESPSFSLVFELIKDSAILCYDRLIYRRRLGDMKVPLEVIVKSESNMATIHFPQNSKSIKVS